MLCQGMDALQRDRCFAGGWILCEGMDAVLGTMLCKEQMLCWGIEGLWGMDAVFSMDAVLGVDALPDHTGMQLKSVSCGLAVGAHARWDAVISANATSSPHVQAGKTAPSIPWASRHPSEPGTSVQGGERPLTHHTVL